MLWVWQAQSGCCAAGHVGLGSRVPAHAAHGQQVQPTVALAIATAVDRLLERYARIWHCAVEIRVSSRGVAKGARRQTRQLSGVPISKWDNDPVRSERR